MKVGCGTHWNCSLLIGLCIVSCMFSAAFITLEDSSPVTLFLDLALEATKLHPTYNWGFWLGYISGPLKTWISYHIRIIYIYVYVYQYIHIRIYIYISAARAYFSILG